MEFSSTTVAAALHSSQDEVETRCDILARNHRFVRSCGMLTWPNGTITEQYVFTHALYQESLYENLVPGRRARLHEQIGAQMEASYGTRAQEIAAELAMHFERGQDFWRAIVYLQYAGEQALQQSAYQEAETYLRRGVTLLDTLPESPAKTEHELTLHYTLGLVVASLKGLASPEAGQIYAHAHALCQQLKDAPQLFHILAGLRRFYSSQGDLQTARSIAEQLDHLAQRSREPQQLIEAHYSQGLVSFCRGDLSVCHTYLERALVPGTPQPHPATPASRHRSPRGDGRSGCLSYTGFALWVLGYPDQAIQRSEAAIHHAQQQALPNTRALALQFAACLRQFRREIHAAQRLAETAMTLATDYALGHWLGQSMILHGWAIAQQEEGQAGLQQMCDGLATKEATGSELLRPYYLSLLAAVYGDIEQPATGLAVLEEALQLVDKNNERWCLAELYRLKGELQLAISMDNESEAEAYFCRSFDVARHQQAKSWELRAATSRARLWQRQDKRQNACGLLQPIYEWFTEGFDTTDLKDAKMLLNELEDGR
jgi:predicted ATPase